MFPSLFIPILIDENDQKEKSSKGREPTGRSLAERHVKATGDSAMAGFADMLTGSGVGFAEMPTGYG